ncbi:Hypothetical predicted protein [Pelobates cultripes]|uniref:Reverse transcriptase zinc-binding domain-containing protein n=1 Tax=Pelobates cultripes TaxID=61616 RepID=A0AAD1QYC0_PELCU|nr:Hypothetical predicted protein [Pelobates cultripes]
MEVAKSDKTPLVDILWTPKTLRPKDNILFPTTSLTLHHWDVLRHSQNTTHKFHPRTPLTALRAISPWLSLNTWVKLGIHKLDQIMHHNLIKPFPELQQEFKLTNSSVFPYMQIKSIIPSHVARATTEVNQSTKVVDTLYDRCWHTPTKPKTLALCYQVVMKTAPHYSPPFVTQWLADCNEPITDKEVEASPTALKGITQCYSHVEAHKKLVYRWYLTPHKLHIMYSSASPLCWRCGETTGTMFHIWWSCQRIRPLWDEAQSILRTIGITEPPLDARTGLFLSYPHSTPKAVKCIMAITALAVRNLIANQWKQPHCPSKTHLLTKIHQYHTYENMTTKTASQRKSFQVSWAPWASYWDGHTPPPPSPCFFPPPVALPTSHRNELHYTGVPAMDWLMTHEVVSLSRRNESHTEKLPPRL